MTMHPTVDLSLRRNGNFARSPRVVLALALAISAGQALALAEDPPPPPAEPVPAQPAPEAAKPAPPAAENAADAPKPSEPKPGAPKAEALKPAEPKANVLDGPPTALAFKGVKVEQIIPFIMEATGKVVVPQNDVLSKPITVMNDRPIPRRQALHLVYLALQQNGIAVIEHEDRIVLRDIGEVVKGDVPVLGPNDSTLQRTDLGAMVEKVFSLKNVTSKKFADAIKDSLPDYKKIIVDEESNQISVIGSVSMLQRVEKLIGSLDRPPAGAITTETFRLRYADAASITTNILDLFSATNRRRQSGDQNQQRNRWQWGGGGGGQEGQAPTAEEINVTANTQQNSVTVAADPIIIEQVRNLITNFWDQPLPEQAVVPRIYELKNSDPVKVRDLLEGLFGRGTPARQAGGGGQPGQQGQPQGGTQATQGIGRLAGQFSFQAIPESGRLVVVAKSPDNMSVIDKIIEGIDQPQTVGLPVIVELKHASSEDLAEQLNALLAQDGTRAQLRRSESGLSSGGGAGVSPFNPNGATTDATTTQDTANANANITFWWQSAARNATGDQRGASNLVGKIRIVPVWRQNAVMVIAPPEYKQSVVDLIQQLDRPGRQVMIAAVIAEVSRDDALNLGLRWSSQSINLTNAEQSVSIGNRITGTRNNWAGSLFDTSVIESTVNLNMVLQALAQKNSVTVLSEPRIFTSDNQEAEFFDGQDIPFISQSENNTVGNPVQTFEYRAVGIQLRARPRITPKREVDLRVNLELSSIVPGQTLFGGFIVDRRETTTQLIIGDGQTIVISGILRQEDSKITRGIPFLSDIPLLGELFKSRENSKSTTELLVFITPLVVENAEDSQRLNQPFNERLDEQLKKSDPIMRDLYAPNAAAKPGPGADADAAKGAQPKKE